MKTKPNDPAFSTVHGMIGTLNEDGVVSGQLLPLTKREYIAIEFQKALMTSMLDSSFHKTYTATGISKLAIAYADILIHELNKEEENKKGNNHDDTGALGY